MSNRNEPDHMAEMREEQNQPPADARRGVLDRLVAADRAHQRELGGRFLFRCAKYLFAAVLALFVLDVALHLGAGWRLVLLGGFLLGAAALFGRAAWLAWRERNQLEHIARFLEDRDPALGSRLINLLQLESQTRDESLAPLTRELAGHAVAGYAAELGEVDFERLARTPQLRVELKKAGWALVAVAALLMVFYPVTLTELARFADPYGDHPAYSFTRLEVVDPGPAGTNVIYGKSAIVKVKVSGHEPKDVLLTAHPPGQPEAAVTLPMFGRGRTGLNQQLENIRTELVVFAHTRDRHSVSKQARIGVILVPQLERAAVQIAPPAYTGIKPEEKPYAFRGVQALVGSRVQFRLQSNRPLREGALELALGDAPPQRLALTLTTNEHEVTGSFEARESGRLRFSLVDRDGIASQETWEGALTVTHDLAPEVQVAEPARDTFVAMDFKVESQFTANDDYGLRTLRIHRGLNGAFSAPKLVSYEGIVRAAKETVELNFAELGVQPGDTVSLFAEAIDNAPEPHLARSQVVNLHVISVEDYNNFLLERSDLSDIQGKYEELFNQLHDLTDEQRKLGEQAVKLKEEIAKAGSAEKDALQRQLDSLLAKQNELNQKLNQQATRMEQFVRKDPLYDVEAELQETLQAQAQKIRESTKQNDAAAKDIAQRSSPEQGARRLDAGMAQDFKRASDEQVARLAGAEKEAQAEVAQTLQDMSLMQELLKDFNQFEALYDTQRSLAEQAAAYNRAGELDRADQLALKNLAATEREVGELLDKLGAKLREDAKAAEKLFPKASKSGERLAEKIQELRLNPLARQATSEMLAGNGENSFRAADRLKGEMEKLFGECKSQSNQPQKDELDQYLSLSRGMNPGKNFNQMMQSRKFGQPGSKQGRATAGARGEGESGDSGYAIMDSQSLDVRGNESFVSHSNASKESSDRAAGKGAPNNDTSVAVPDKSDVMKGLNPVNRQSGAVATESLIEEYSTVVDRYFKTITKEGARK